MEKREADEAQPLINLSLGLCGPSSLNCRATTPSDDKKCQREIRSVKVEIDDFDRVVEREGCRKSSVVSFTEEQLQELKLQFIIFKYLVFGLPLPLQLVLPLFSTSSPSFAHTSSPCWLDICSRGTYRRNLMDPEPGRCRRTDGKKWRCYQSVVPNEKYCEKHMHRGRKRSRKLVEEEGTTEASNANENPSKDPEITPEDRKLVEGVTSEASNVKENLTVASTPAFEVPAILNKKSEPPNQPSKVEVRAPYLTLTNMTAKWDEKAEPNIEGKHNLMVKEKIAAINLASGLDFSPKSVLHDGHRCSGIGRHRKESEFVLQRCSRTDGKRWRCYNEALLAQKYCAHHISRGQKKPAVSISAFREHKTAFVSSSMAKFSGHEQAKIGMCLDTDLKISLPTNLADPRHSIRDSAAGSSSSSSDPGSETTISDDSAYISNLIALSP